MDIKDFIQDAAEPIQEVWTFSQWFNNGLFNIYCWICVQLVVCPVSVKFVIIMNTMIVHLAPSLLFTRGQACVRKSQDDKSHISQEGKVLDLGMRQERDTRL